MARVTAKGENGHYYMSGDGIFSTRTVPDRFEGEDVDRIGVLEDILRDDYNLDKLRKLVEAEKADEIGKYRFYYCESEDEYLIGARLDRMYYARWSGNSFVWSMSRHLPWGQHIVDPQTAWKEYTYPSEPKEIDISEWFKGFLSQRIKEALKEKEK